MNPRLALVAVLPVLLKLHLSIAIGGGVVTVSMPWVIPVILTVAVVVFLALACRHLRGFRSSPHLRTVNA